MEEVSLREYIEVMLRWKWLIIGLTLIAMVTAAVVSFFFMTPVYEAQAVFSLEVPAYEMGEAAKAAVQQIGITIAGPDAVLTSLSRPDFLKRMVGRLGGEGKEPVSRLHKELKIEANKEKNSFTITARTTNPERAQEITNAAVEELKAYVSELGEQGMDHGLQALEVQRQEVEKALGTTQEELRRLMAQPPTLEQLQAERDALNDGLAAGLERQTSLPGKLAATQAELARTQGLLAGLPEKTVLKKALLAPNGGALVPVEEETINPNYQALRDRVNELSGQAAGLSAEEKAVARMIEQNTKRLAEINLQVVEQSQMRSSLEEKVTRQKKVLGAMADQLNQLWIARAVGGRVPVVKVLAPAELPDSPVSPRGKLNVAVAAVLGLMVSVFLAFFIEYWRTSGSQGMAPGAGG